MQNVDEIKELKVLILKDECLKEHNQILMISILIFANQSF